jgi:sporulation protein YlmC with PRC-barrel domain
MARTLTFPKVLSASTLKDEKVVNSKGENLGKIEDYMIDLDNGRIAYCVLSFGGFWAWATSCSWFPSRR